MNKYTYFLIIILLLPAVLLSVSPEKAAAQSVEESTGIIDEYLDETSGGVLSSSGISVSGGDAFSGLTPSGILSWIKERINENIRAPLSVLSVLMSVVLLTAAFSGFFVPQGRTCSRAAETVSILAALTAVTDQVGSCVTAAAQAVEDGSLFMLSFVPVMSTVTSVSGGAAAAGSYSLVTVGFCELASGFSARILMPAVSLCMCISIIDSVNPELSLQGLLNMIRKGSDLMLGLAVTVFSGLLAIENIAGSAADSAAVKTGKYLVSNLVPAVGRSVSDACSAVYVSLGILKTGVGTAGIAVSILTAAVPLIRLFMLRFSLTAAGAAAEILGCGGLKKLFNDLGTVLGMVISIVVVFIVMLTVSTALVMKSASF